MRGAAGGGLAAGAVGGGGVAGLVLAMAQAEPAPDVAGPVPAVSPSVPVAPPPPTRPDTDSPALQPGLDYTDAAVGANGFEVDLRVPEGWKRVDIDGAEAKWLMPGNRRNTFLLRVESVSQQRRSVAAMKAERIRDLREITDSFTLVRETRDSIHVVYLDNGLTRYGNLRWIESPDPGSDQAVVEVAANGRARDQAGLLDLLGRVSHSVEARL